MAKICLISDLHLVSNPRLWKEANALARSGYEVVIQTVWTSAEKRKGDLSLIHDKEIRYEGAVNLIPGEVPALRRFYYRLRHRLAVEAKKWLGVDSPWILGYAPGGLTKVALKQKADLYICHAEFGILVGRNLVLKGCRVAYDIEDWYSRDYLVRTRPVKLLEQLEAFALRNGLYCSCPSMSMAQALQNQYGGNMPAVIYNGFPVSEIPVANHPQPKAPPSFIWFSQTIGPGRGLELLIDILEQLSIPVEVHLLGDCVEGYDQQLKGIFPFSKGHSLFFHAAVPHQQLLARISQYQVGLALELNQPDNKDTTVSNKILQYLQAGIRVLATNTRGQQEVAEFFPGAVELLPLENRDAWVPAIERLLKSRPDTDQQQDIFRQKFSWEAQEIKLLQLVKQALA